VKVLLAHPGTQYSFRLAFELHRHDLLGEFHTGLAFSEDSVAGRLAGRLPQLLRRRAANRVLTGVPRSKIRLHAWKEMMSAVRTRRQGDHEAALHQRNAWFQGDIPTCAINAVSAVIGFDTSSWILARRARESGRAFFLDQSIAHPLAKERVFDEMRTRFPNWATTIPKKREAHLAEETEEHNLASVVVAPSRFVTETLAEAGVPRDRMRIVPFGTDTTLFHPADTAPPPEPLTFLFVGSISARKGVPVLMAAWRRAALRRARLWIAGNGAVPREELAAGIPETVHFLGPQSRDQVASLMRRAHVFVFPSFFEGLAQVQVEALASCLPVIATHESGGSDLIEAGGAGTIIPAGDIDAMINALEAFARDPAAIVEMRKHLNQVRDRWSWAHYGDRWAALLTSVV
jgi:glycosyltransferase involved in cell wall biosynthesis